MKYTRAKEIIQQLSEGKNPANPKEDLPAESILHTTDVVRALVLASKALEAADDREKRRVENPSRQGQRWTDEEDARLVADFHMRKPLQDLATEFGRSLRSIEARLLTKGLITEAERTTRDRFDS